MWPFPELGCITARRVVPASDPTRTPATARPGYVDARGLSTRFPTGFSPRNRWDAEGATQRWFNKQPSCRSNLREIGAASGNSIGGASFLRQLSWLRSFAGQRRLSGGLTQSCQMTPSHVLHRQDLFVTS